MAPNSVHDTPDLDTAADPRPLGVRGARVLDPAEWLDKLRDTPLAGTTLDPDESFIVVVEAPDGTVLACWAAFNAVHVEGVWVHPAHRRQGGVARALLDAMTQALRARDIREVITNAEDAAIEAIIQKLGGILLPGTCWLIRL